MNEIEKAIDDLDDLKNCESISSSHFKEVHGKNLELAISALEKQLSNGWIPVSERLPTKEEFNKNDGRFIVTDGMRRYQSLFDIYEGKYFVDITYLGNCNFKETVDNRVIAWQNLPELYKEESE